MNRRRPRTEAIKQRNAGRRSVARPWAHEYTDIPVHPAIRYGSLPTGLRFAYVHRPEPRNRIYLRLHLCIGSLAERDDERGMAHLIEHLCFVNSRDFPGNTLNKWFDRNGLAFGADSNAVTGFLQTTYMLDLPKNDRRLFEEALTVMRNFADGMVVTDESFNSERRIIDAEERESDAVSLRVLKDSLARQFPDSLMHRRFPIGDTATRAKFTKELVTAFYKKWYRPQFMTIVAGGDLAGIDVERAIHRAFDSFEAPPGPEPRIPSLAQPRRATNSVWIADRELATTEVGFGRVLQWKHSVPTVASARKKLAIRFARHIINTRLSELARRKGSPVLQASVADNQELWAQLGLPVEGGEAVGASCKNGQWRQAFAACEQEVRRAVEFGFEASEVAEATAGWLRDLDDAVERESSRSSISIINDIIGEIEYLTIPRDAATNRNIFEVAIRKLTPADCHAAFRKAWNDGEMVWIASGPRAPRGDPRREIAELWKRSRSVKLQPVSRGDVGAFAYDSSKTPPGRIASRRACGGQGAEIYIFENGAKVILKNTSLHKGQIALVARVGEGRLQSRPSDTAIPYVVEEVFLPCALEAHGFEELRRVLVSHHVTLDFQIQEDSFVFFGATSREHFARQMEVLCAYIEHPGMRQEGFDEFKKNLPSIYDSLKHSPQGVIDARFTRDLYSGDTRWAIPERKAVENVTLRDIVQFIKKPLREGPLTVVVVGDFNRAQISRVLARTVGNLGTRRAMRDYNKNRIAPRFATGRTFEYECTASADRTQVRVCFPTSSAEDYKTGRHLDFLAEILNERIRQVLRETLGAAYAPSVGAESSEVYPGDGYISVDVSCDLRSEQLVLDAVAKTIETLEQEGITQAEIQRARRTGLHQLRDVRRTNGWWAQALSEIHTRPRAFEEIDEDVQLLKTTTAAELQQLQAKYLKMRRAVTAIVRPAGSRAGRGARRVRK